MGESREWVLALGKLTIGFLHCQNTYFFSYACSRFMKIEIKITLGRIGNFINSIVQMRKLRKKENTSELLVAS